MLLPYQVVEKPLRSGAVVSAKELNARVDGICFRRGVLSGGTGGGRQPAAWSSAPPTATATHLAMIYPLQRQGASDITAWEKDRTLPLCVDIS